MLEVPCNVNSSFEAPAVLGTNLQTVTEGIAEQMSQVRILAVKERSLLDLCVRMVGYQRLKFVDSAAH